MKVNTEEATEHIIACMKAKLACFLSGSPGTGKSMITQAIGERFNLKIIDIRLSQCDPVEVMGFPQLNNGVADYVPMAMWPTVNTPIPAGYDGFLLILDEFNSASMATQAASYRIILDREVGQIPLHPKTAVVCIGNLATDNAIVNRLSTAMQSRLIHLEVDVDAKIWLEKWAIQNNIDHRVLAYISRYPDRLYNFDPEHDDKTFSCPRTWHFLSTLIQQQEGNLMPMLALLAGTVGEGVAREFIMFTSIYEKLPTLAQIKAAPTIVPVDDDPNMLWATSHFLSSQMTDTLLPQVMPYIERLPIEFETITLQNVMRKNSSLQHLPCIQKWIREKGAELF